MKLKSLITLLLAFILISACAPATTPAPMPDVNAVRTSAASTVVSEFTLTAAVFTNTPEPPPTDTLTPEAIDTATPPPVAQVTNAQGTPVDLCDKYSWDDNTVDVNVPDKTEMTPGQDFTKTWRIKNIGICTWGAGYSIIYSYGEKMSGQPIAFGEVAPGQEVDVSVQFKAPTKPGQYFSAWTLSNAKGVTFFGDSVQGTYKEKPLIVVIVVK